MAANGISHVEATLESILASVRLDSAFYFSVRAKGSWATLTPHMDNIGTIVMPEARRVLPFHVMVEGEAWCWLARAPKEKRRFRTGEVLLLPRGCDHIIASGQDPAEAPQADIEVYREAERSGRPCTHVTLGEGENASQFVCGYFGAPRQRFHPVFDALPDLMVFPIGEDRWGQLVQLMSVATAAQSERQSAGKLIAARLAETMFIDAIYSHLAGGAHDTQSGWIEALREPQVGAALHKMHSEPFADWSVASLAEAVGVSRSGFSDRFGRLVGLSPMRYLQRWRMQIAGNLLAQTDEPIADVAFRCGYLAETSFNRAFRREFDLTPGAWRRLHRST